MFKQRTSCNICGKKLDHKTLNNDPYFYLYKCDDCGYYVSLDEIYNYMEPIDSPIISKSALDNYKSKHDDIDFDYTCMIIGNTEDINHAKNNNFEKCLQKNKFSFDKVVYVNINGETNE